MAEQVEVDIKVNVDDGELPKLKDKLKQAGDEGKQSFDTIKSSSGTCLTEFMSQINQTPTKITSTGSAWDGIKGKVVSVASSIGSHMGSALSRLKSAVRSVGDAFTGLGGVITSVMGGIGLAQVKDMTLGLSMNRQQVQALTYATLGAGAATDKLWQSMDTTTTRGLVSLDDLSQAMSVIKMSTGASTDQLSRMMPVVNDIGQRAILMGRNGTEAITLMQAAGKGLNGEFNMLQDNFGITKDKLKALGWSGAAKDVDGYTQALQKYLDKGGSMDGMLNTTNGKIVTLQKNFRVAGRKLGDELLPYMDQALDLLNKWSDPETGNGFAQYAIGVAGVASGFATLAPTISPCLDIMDNLGSKFGTLNKNMGATKAVSTFFTSMSEGTGILGSVSAAWDVMATSEWAALWPILAIVAAIIAIGAAFYELGKYLGWWNDLSGMVDAAWSAIQRFWDAFINHPDVQAIIEALGAAWEWLVEVTRPLVDWLKGIWNEVFPPSASGQVDGVGIALEVLGKIWDVMTMPIRMVVNGLKAFFQIMSMVGGAGVDAFTSIYETLSSVWDVIQFIGAQVLNFFLPVINGLQMITTVVQGMFTGQIGLLDGVMMIGQAIASMYVGFWQNLSNLFMQGFMSLVNIVTTNLMTVWQGFLSFLSQLSSVPGRVGAYLMSVVAKVISWAANMVSKAQSAASNFVNSIINGIASLPSKFRQSIDRVLTELTNWGKRMVDKAAQIMRDVANYIGQVTGLTSGFSGDFSGNFSGNFSSGFSNDFNEDFNSGFDTSNTLNNVLSTQVSNNNSKSNITNNFSINGIIEEEAADFIVSKVNEHVRRQNLIRGV